MKSTSLLWLQRSCSVHRSVIHNGSWKLERCAQQVVTVCMSCLDGFKESFLCGFRWQIRGAWQCRGRHFKGRAQRLMGDLPCLEELYLILFSGRHFMLSDGIARPTRSESLRCAVFNILAFHGAPLLLRPSVLHANRCHVYFWCCAAGHMPPASTWLHLT